MEASSTQAEARDGEVREESNTRQYSLKAHMSHEIYPSLAEFIRIATGHDDVRYLLNLKLEFMIVHYMLL
jgi:hypothetical protein